MKTTREKDVPDYKAMPLRWPFLIALLVFACGLLGLMEHLVQTLPNEHNRKEIPREFPGPFVPAQEKYEIHQSNPATYISSSYSVSPAMSPQASDGGQAALTKPVEASPTDMSVATTKANAIITERAVIHDASPRPPPSAFASPGVLTTYITWINSWAGRSHDGVQLDSDPWTRTPLFSGQEPGPGQCIYHYQGVVMTSNSSACAAVVAPIPNLVMPKGWKRGTWVHPMIWFPVGGGCDENYDDWYSGYPSNTSFPLGDLGYQLDVAMPAFFMCTMPKFKRDQRTVLPTSKEARSDSQDGSILLLYVANHKRGPDNRIIWPMGPNTETRPAPLGPMFYLEYLLDLLFIGQRRPYLDIPPTEMRSTPVVQTTPETSPSAAATAQEKMPTESAPLLSPAGSATRVVESTSARADQSIELKPTATPTSGQKEPGFSSLSQWTTPSSASSSIATTNLGEISNTTPLAKSPALSAGTQHQDGDANKAPGVKQTPSHWVTFVQLPVVSLDEVLRTGLDSNGHLATQTDITLRKLTLLAQVPAIMAPASLQTLIDPQGRPTAIVTNYGSGHGEPILITTIATLTDVSGNPTAVIETTIPATSVVQTLFDPSNNIPTATITNVPIFPHIPGSQPADLILANTPISYYTIYFLPILLTALLLIPIQAVDSEIKLLLPYRLLTKTPDGDSADALCMCTSGVLSRFHNGWRLLLVRHRDPISIISDVMLLSAALLVALSVETIGLKLRGSCSATSSRTCLLTIAIFLPWARAAEGLLATIAGCILLLAYMLGRWKTGIAVHPSSVAAVCSLIQIPETRDLLLRSMKRVRWESHVYGGTRDTAGSSGDINRHLAHQFEGSRLRLGRIAAERAGTGPRAEEYGLVFVEVGPALRDEIGRVRYGSDTWWLSQLLGKSRAGAASARGGGGRKRMKYHVLAAERALQCVFLFVLCGLLALVLYYENTEFANPAESPFEWFMDSQGVGVAMLFSGLGLVISFTWDYFFSSRFWDFPSRFILLLLSDFDKRSIYLRMSHRPQPAHLSILCVRSPTVISGLISAIRHHDPLAGSISLAGLLSKFLPAPLASVPFQSAQTWQTHEICVWTTVALLLAMIAVLLAHMWVVKWPYMPAAPDSLAGWIYYVCDSAMLRDFERLSMVGQRERDGRVERMGRVYRFGWMTGVSGFGINRIGIDYPEGEQGYKMYSLGAFGFGVTGRRV